MRKGNVMLQIANIKDVVGKRLTGVQNRHNAITIETDGGQWTAKQSGQASVEGRYESVIGAEIVDADEHIESDSLAVYTLRTVTEILIFRSRSI